jgi:hypothetical protein
MTSTIIGYVLTAYMVAATALAVVGAIRTAE